MKHHAPARGALAGVKADAERAKNSGGTYDPNAHGSAWSHNFLNQKPWHPLNFRNQQKVWEAEQAAVRDAKAKEQSKAEFEAEQEYLKSLSYLSEEEQKKYAERQSISFMYMKPPGFDAAQQRDTAKSGPGEAAPAGGGNAAVSGSGAAAQSSTKPESRRAAPTSGHLANMLGAMAALHQQDRFEVKHVSGMGRRSPPRGGADLNADNQQILTAETDFETDRENAAQGLQGATGRKRKRLKLEEAQAFLKAAGLDVDAVAAQLARNEERSEIKKGKHEHKHKNKHKHKHKKS